MVVTDVPGWVEHGAPSPGEPDTPREVGGYAHPDSSVCLLYFLFFLMVKYTEHKIYHFNNFKYTIQWY